MRSWLAGVGAATCLVLRATARGVAGARRQLLLVAGLLGAVLAGGAEAQTPSTGTVTGPAFAAPSINPFGLADVGEYASPAFADIDGDGDLDAFSGEYYGNTIFFENTGTASVPAFAAPSTNPFGLAEVRQLSSPAFADIDLDGDLDAFVGEVVGNTIFFENTGTASAPAFTAPSINPFGLADVGDYASPAFADLDGDGDLDAFVGEAFGNTLFFENTGNASAPTFAAPSINPFGLVLPGAGGSPAGIFASLAFADLDGDGDLDALVGEKLGNTFFLENTGTASAPAFAAPSTNLFGLTDVGDHASPAFADLDGDGDLDAFVGNQVGDTFFFENTTRRLRGRGLFAAPSINPFGLAAVGASASPAFADLDGDGDLDAFVGEYDGNTIFFENTGTASAPALAAPSINPFGLADVGDYASPAFADLDGDGDLDAFVGEAFGNTLFFENTGTASAPTFAAPVTNPFGLATVGASASPAFADLDGDGDLDAFVGDLYGNTVFFSNTGTASIPAFAASVTNPFGLATVGAHASADFVDLDGDGDLDALVGEDSGNTLFFRNTGTASVPAFAAPSANPFGLADVGGRASPAFADLDGDGDLDAFVGELYGNTIFLENTGPASAPAFAAPVTNPLGLRDVGWWASPAFADIDGDGDLDAFVGDYDGKTLFFRNTGTAGTPSFAASGTDPFGLATVGGRASPAFADLDGDGDLDAFVGDLYGNTVFFRNTGTAGTPAFAASAINPFGLATVGAHASPDFADLDGDGDLDAFVGEHSGNTLFFENTGTASVPAFAAPSTNPFGLAHVGGRACPTFADLEGDGDLDAFVGEYPGNTLFFENTGTASVPAFAAPVTNSFGLGDVGWRASPAFADIDLDGDLDAFVGEYNGSAFFFENLDLGNERACFDGLDNDLDGRIDFPSDPGCVSVDDLNEHSGHDCDNGLDDDNDGWIDWREDTTGDPQCDSLSDNLEAVVPPTGGCGLGPELALLVPALLALQRRRVS